MDAAGEGGDSATHSRLPEADHHFSYIDHLEEGSREQLANATASLIGIDFPWDGRDVVRIHRLIAAKLL